MEFQLASHVRAVRARLDRALKLLRHLRNNPLAFAGLLIVLGILVLALLAPLLAPPNHPDPYQRPRTWMRPEPPGTPGHPLGTGLNGADIYYGIIWGTRISLRIGATVVGATLLIGILLGGLAGYFGRWVDEVIMRLTDLFMSIPGLILAMAVVSALGRSLDNILIALVIVWWPWYVRIFRSQVLVTKESQYIEAAKSSGASERRVIFNHIVPNSLSPVIVQASLDMGVTLLIAAGLSFIGFGAEPGFAEWGIMIAEGKDFMAQGFWWMVFFPGLAISIFVLGFNLLGDGLRDVLDPKLRVMFRQSPKATGAETEPIRDYRRISPPSRLRAAKALLGIEDLSLRFQTQRGESKVLEDVSLEIRQGETFGLVGETGCGKSVTAKTILGLIDRPPARITGGSAWYLPDDGGSDAGDRDLLMLDESRLAAIRGNAISMVFQDPMTSLNPVFEVGEQIAEAYRIHQKEDILRTVATRLDRTQALLRSGDAPARIQEDGREACSRCGHRASDLLSFCAECNAYFRPRLLPSLFLLRIRLAQRRCRAALQEPGEGGRTGNGLSISRLEQFIQDEALARVIELIRSVRIPDPEKTASSYPFELSGGMQQRVSIAMALASRPSLLIADEPTTALDVTIQAQILKLISDLKEEIGMSVFLITHNLGVVAEQCDRVAVMYAGAIAEVADVEPIFKNPLHPYTQGLIQAIPILGAQREELEIIPGRVPDLVEPPSGCRFRTRCRYAFDKCAEVVPSLEEIEPGHWVSCHLYEPGADDGN